MSGALAGRHILVTGGAKGIGAATVERFLAEGAKVAVLDRDEQALNGLGGRLEGELFTVTADVCDPQAVTAAVSACSRQLGALDGVVNAAGVDLVADIEAMTIEAWNQVLSVNLTGPMLVMRASYPHLKAAGGGTIVNVSSGAGLMPLANRMAYCASKAGLQMASKALAMEAAPFGIRINTVCPGAVETDLFRLGLEATPDPQAAYEAVRMRYALRRIASPNEIAAAILWLTSSESSYVTGTAIAVDGGRTFH
jgi:NAD(P)-dependent dehydrogenase (short-subunit alcohol dehydrogenase family)